MPTIIEKIGSRPVTVAGLFQSTSIPINLIVKYCEEDPIRDNPNDVYYDIVALGYVIEIGRPYGRPDGVGGTETPINGYSAHQSPCGASQTVEGFEVTSYSVRRDTNSKGLFYVDITNEMVEYQQWNHATSQITPGSTVSRAWRVRPDIPTLSEDGTNGYTEDLVPQYADNTLNSGDIGGQYVDINCQPISLTLWRTSYTLSFVSRRPYYATAVSSTQTVDNVYSYWTDGPGSLISGKRLETTNGNLTPIGSSLLAVGDGVSITPIVGTWVRVDVQFAQREWSHLEQFPFSVEGVQPVTVERFPSATGFKMTSAEKVGFMDVNPEIVNLDMQYLPCRVLTLWQEQVGTY